MTDRDYALLCQRSYTGVPDFGTSDGARAFRAQIGGALTICFPGSRSFEDWVVDAFAVPVPDFDEHGEMGDVHAGFLERAHNCLALVKETLTGAENYVLTGHSLGGAIALLVGAMMIADFEGAPSAIVTFGAPRVGMSPLVKLLRNVPIRQYRFGADPVPLVPTSPPYVHAREPLLQIGQKVPDLLANHSIVNYLGALPG